MENFWQAELAISSTLKAESEQKTVDWGRVTGGGPSTNWSRIHEYPNGMICMNIDDVDRVDGGYRGLS